MGLYERMTSSESDKISEHTFGAAMREVARGHRSLNDLITAFSLDAEAQAELTAIRDAYLALSTASKPQFMMLMEDAFILASAGHYNKVQVKQVLGF